MLRNRRTRRGCLILAALLGMLLVPFIAFYLALPSTGMLNFRLLGEGMVLLGVDLALLFLFFGPLTRGRRLDQPASPGLKARRMLLGIGIGILAIALIPEGIWWVAYPSVALEVHWLSILALLMIANLFNMLAVSLQIIPYIWANIRYIRSNRYFF